MTGSISMKHIIKVFIILDFLILATGQTHAQKSKREYFKIDKSGRYEDSELAKAKLLKFKNPKEAIALIENVLVRNYKMQDLYTEAQCYQLLGEINANENLLELALKNTEKAKEIYSNLKEEDLMMGCILQMAKVQAQQQQYDQAINNYTKFINYRAGSRIENTRARLALAAVYKKQKKYNEAVQVLQKALSQEEDTKNSSYIGEINNEIGENYSLLKKNEQALDYYEKAQKEATESKDSKTILKSNKNISSVFNQKGKFKDELKVRKQSLSLSKDIRDTLEENKENLAIANTYIQINKPESAIPYIKRSISLSEKTGDLEEKAKAVKILSEAYSQDKQYNIAMETYKEYVALKDSALTEREQKLDKIYKSAYALTETQKEMDILIKDLEVNEKTINALLSEQHARDEKLNRQKALIYFLIILVIVIAIASYLIYKNAQKRRIANQLLALKSLRSQMNPHFIFNALNSVNSFISKNDERAANKYLADFSKLMRLVMENSQLDFVPLANEIQVISLYLSLEHFRFKDKFDYEFEVDPQVDVDAIEIPPMLIQPYIENAVWHGLRYKEQKGILTVKIQLLGENSLKVLIADNGIGRARSTELKTKNQKSTISTGIKNTINRISIINEMYHKKISIDIADLQPQEVDKGTLVQLVLP